MKRTSSAVEKVQETFFCEEKVRLRFWVKKRLRECWRRGVAISTGMILCTSLTLHWSTWKKLLNTIYQHFSNTKSPKIQEVKGGIFTFVLECLFFLLYRLGITTTRCSTLEKKLTEHHEVQFNGNLVTSKVQKPKEWRVIL